MSTYTDRDWETDNKIYFVGGPLDNTCIEVEKDKHGKILPTYYHYYEPTGTIHSDYTDRKPLDYEKPSSSLHTYHLKKWHEESMYAANKHYECLAYFWEGIDMSELINKEEGGIVKKIELWRTKNEQECTING